MMKRSKSSFSLIELLVVIAIISVLASLLLPALSRAKSHAFSAVCMSNLKQQALIVRYYADDHNEWLTPYYSGNGDDYDFNHDSTDGGEYGAHGSFITFIQGYDQEEPISNWGANGRIKNEIFLCPADKSGRKLDMPSREGSYHGAHGVWQRLNDRWGKFNPPFNDWSSTNKAVRITKDIKSPSDTPLIGDVGTLSDTDLRSGVFAEVSAGTPITTRANNYIVNSGSLATLRLSHSDGQGFNLSFFDGHTERGEWPTLPEGLTIVGSTTINPILLS